MIFNFFNSWILLNFKTASEFYFEIWYFNFEEMSVEKQMQNNSWNTVKPVTSNLQCTLFVLKC